MGPHPTGGGGFPKPVPYGGDWARFARVMSVQRRLCPAYGRVMDGQGPPTRDDVADAMLGAADVLRHVERAIFCGVTAAGFLPLSPGAQGFGPGLLATHCGGNPTAQTKRPLILHRPDNPGACNG